MDDYQDTMKHNNKIKIIIELLQKQIMTDEKKKEILIALNYLEYRQIHNEDDIYLEREINLLYDCIL
jgi:hypothetical protein